MLSASSSAILLSSSGEDKEKESLLFPEGDKNHKPQKAGRTQSGGNIHKMIRGFDLFEENALPSLHYRRENSGNLVKHSGHNFG